MESIENGVGVVKLMGYNSGGCAANVLP